MDINTLKALVSSGESEVAEFKKTTAQLQRAGETLCGMLNGRGGQVLIGVSAEGRVLGQMLSDKTSRETAAVLQKFEPPVLIMQTVIKLTDDKSVLILEADPNKTDRPYTFDGRAYQRIGSTTSTMPQVIYQRLLIERVYSTTRWEMYPARSYSIDDLDSEEILRTVRIGIAAGRLPEATGHNIPDILGRLDVLEDGCLNHAAVVLFGTRFSPEYPQCQLRLARFRGVDKSEFLDNKQVEGNAFRLFEEAMLFLRRHLPVAGRILPGVIERVDEPLFPLEALREALVNAFCHRDYSVVGGAVNLAIYDDRLEIWSEGLLPPDIRPEDLKREHSSNPRNLTISKVFHKRGMFEEWGRGTQKIVRLCVEAGHPEPEFGQQAGSVWVRFLPGNYTIPHHTAHDLGVQQSPSYNPALDRPQPQPRRAVPELTARQEDILQIVADHGPLPLREIMNKTKQSSASVTVRKDLYYMKTLGLVDSTGHGHGAKWLICR